MSRKRNELEKIGVSSSVYPSALTYTRHQWFEQIPVLKGFGLNLAQENNLSARLEINTTKLRIKKKKCLYFKFIFTPCFIMFTIEICKNAMNKKLGLHPTRRKQDHQRLVECPIRRHSLEAYSGFLHLPTANGSKNTGQMRLVRSLIHGCDGFRCFSQYSQGSGFSQSLKTQGIQFKGVCWGFSIPKHGFSQQVQSGSLSSIVLWEDNLWPCHPQHWTSILMLTYVDPLISWQVAVENSPFTIIYFDDLPNLSQTSLKMVIFQFANCYSSHYQRLCLKRPIRSNHTQVQTGTQMRPSIFLCDIPHLMGEDTQLSTDEKNDEGFNKQPDNHFLLVIHPIIHEL